MNLGPLMILFVYDKDKVKFILKFIFLFYFIYLFLLSKMFASFFYKFQVKPLWR